MSWVETPKGLLLVAVAMATIFGAVFGVLGYKLGATPAQPIVIQLQAPK